MRCTTMCLDCGTCASHDDALELAISALREKQERERYGDEPEGRLDCICGSYNIGYSDSLFLRELLRSYEDEDERENSKPLTLSIEEATEAIELIEHNGGCPPSKDCAEKQNCHKCYMEWLTSHYKPKEAQT